MLTSTANRAIFAGVLVVVVIVAATATFLIEVSRFIEVYESRQRTLYELTEITSTRMSLQRLQSAASVFDQDRTPEHAAALSHAIQDLRPYLTRRETQTPAGSQEWQLPARFNEHALALITLLDLDASLPGSREARLPRGIVASESREFDLSLQLLSQLSLQEQNVLRGQLDQWRQQAEQLRIRLLGSATVELLALALFVAGLMAYQKKLRESASQVALANIAETADDAIFSLDLSGRIRTWNVGAERMYGYSALEIVGMSDSVLSHPNDRNKVDSLIEGVKHGKRVQRLEAVRVAKDGSLLSVLRSVWPAVNDRGEVVGANVISRNITSQKSAQEELLRSEGQYRILFASHPLPMWVAQSPGLSFLAVNDAAVHHYGYTRDQFLAMTVADISVPGTGEEGSGKIAVSSERVQFLKQRRRDGSLIDVELTSHSVSFEGQEAILMLAQDVTEQRQAKSRLLASEQKFAKAFHLSPLGVTISTRTEGRYVDVNETFLEMVGYGRDEVIGKTAFDLHMWANEAERAAWLSKIDRGGSGGMLATTFTTSSGDARSVKVFAEPLELEGVACILAVTEDVTETKQLETQLRQAQKMEAVGRLAGGVAHDFNNVLGVIGGYAELLHGRTEDPVTQKQLGEIRIAVDRAASLTRQLLAFSRKQVLQPKALDLNERIRELTKMLRRLIGDDIELVVHSADSLACVEADPGQIDQVILNLVVNARDAMPRGGKLVIETANTQLDKNADFQRGSINPGQYVMLAVSDTGEGMGPEVLSHIFEPFFTTKEQGRGTGLGLSTVHGIVNQSGGHIWVASQPGKGSTFKVYLPVVGKPAKVEEEKVESHIVPGSGTILLVEDESQMRALMRQLLVDRGYRVLEAADGAEALALAKGADIQLLLTDVLMPNLSGPALADQIQVLHPDIAVIYMSGYTDELLVHHGALQKGVSFLEKPFTSDHLIHSVQTALRLRSAPGADSTAAAGAGKG